MNNLISSNLFNHPFFNDPFESFSQPLAKLQALNFGHSNYEIYEEDGKFVAKFNVPGHVGMEDIKAEVDKETSVLSVESKKIEESKEENEGRIYHHRGESACHYQIRLPKSVNLETASALCENGQLKISFDLFDDDEAQSSRTLSIPIDAQTEKV